jgi:hypothetical protein
VTEKRAGDQAVMVPVDLIVPTAAASPAGRRGARLGTHGNRAARKIAGLEAALVDHAPMLITALDPRDPRTRVAEVAGPAALLVAKVHKLHERVVEDRSSRLDDKDAADVVRLMQGTRASEVGPVLAELTNDPLAGPVTSAALTYLEELFGRRGRPGVQMATRALRAAVPGQRIEIITSGYVRSLLEIVAS